MGFIGTYGTETTAPEYHCSVRGTPSWSGKHEAEITHDIQHDIGDFIRVEARRKGNNDYVQNCIGENGSFFNEKFLNGWPHQMWSEHYENGVNEARIRANR
ncbi:hypothetical protein DDN60_12550 [Vibrio cholerae]|nr:hypothetical protein [Vibrio cholerae]